MKDSIIQQVKDTIKDRQLISLIAVIATVATVFIVYVLTNLQYRDTPVVTHYTSYGSQHLYDSSWFEMLSFIGFALVVMIGHAILMVKLSKAKDRNAVFVLFYATLMVMAIAFIIAHQVLRVAVL